MELCSVCGSHKKVCHVCGAELHKHFDSFIVRAEIIYAIFMAWGYAASADAIIRAWSWAASPLLVISTFVLIRFFFAPTRNLYTASLISEKHKRWRWVIFVLDFPLLIFHSFAYYTMCVAVMNGDKNAYRFFQWFVILLSTNIVWLTSIAARMRIVGRRRHFWTFIRWSVNNFISVLLFYIAISVLSGNCTEFFRVFFTKNLPLVISAGGHAYWIFFCIAFSNCIIDVISTASDYLGFES